MPITLPLVTTGKVPNNTPASFAKANLIYNGDMSLWNTFTSFVGPASGTYDAEGFRHIRAGTMVVNTARTTVVPPANGHVGRLVHSSIIRITTAQTSLGSSDFLAYQYFIEGSTARAIMGGPFVVSFWVFANTTGTFALAIRNAGADRSWITNYEIPTASTWHRIVKVIDTPPTAGTWNYENGIGLNICWTLACGTALQTTTPDAWITGSFLGTPSQTNFAAAVNNDWYLTGVKVEPGSVATPMLPDPTETTLSRSSRYFYKTYNLATPPGTSGVSGASAATAVSVGSLWGLNLFPVPMRVSPTVTVYANDGTPNRVTSSGGVTTGTAALTALAIRDRGFLVVQDTGLPFTTGSLYTYNFVANARLP
ncbi:MAG: hypothetical protein SNJ59_07275 [Aggregatilineales bacterium]